MTVRCDTREATAAQCEIFLLAVKFSAISYTYSSCREKTHQMNWRVQTLTARIRLAARIISPVFHVQEQLTSDKESDKDDESSDEKTDEMRVHMKERCLPKK